MGRDGPDAAADPLENPALYVGVANGEHDARRRLLRYLYDAGATIEMLEAAAFEDRLATLPLEFALSTDRRYTLTEVAREARISPQYLRAALLALGHPAPRPRERMFTAEDVEIAHLLRRFLDVGLPRDELLDVMRVLGQSMARVAAVIRLMVARALIRPGDTEHDLAMRYAAAATELAPLVGPILEHQWRMHLREQATQDVITSAEREAGVLAQMREVAVCFTDLSGFTRLGTKLPVDRVGAIGSRMAALASEVARPPVELVKTIGDGAMLVSPDVDLLLDATLELKARVDAEGADFPSIRAGVAWGRAISRGGDWFGPAVNRASRIVDVARPGTVLVDDEAREHADERFAWAGRKRRSLRGIERRVRLHVLAPPAPTAA